jgi:xylulokinase
MTVSKIRWLARVEPQNASKTTAVVLPHDWLSWQIGGSQLLSYDRSRRCIGHLLLRRDREPLPKRSCGTCLGHDLELPRVAAPNEVIGYTPDGIAIAPGTGDNMAGGLGLGVASGAAVVSLGTSGTAFTKSSQQTHEPTGTVAGFAMRPANSFPWCAPSTALVTLVAAAQYSA